MKGVQSPLLSNDFFLRFTDLFNLALGCASKIRELEEGFEDAGREEEGAEWRNFWDYMREQLSDPIPAEGPEVVDDILLCKTAVDPYEPSATTPTRDLHSHRLTRGLFNLVQGHGSTEVGCYQEGR